MSRAYSKEHTSVIKRSVANTAWRDFDISVPKHFTNPLGVQVAIDHARYNRELPIGYTGNPDGNSWAYVAWVKLKGDRILIHGGYQIHDKDSTAHVRVYVDVA